MTSRGAWLALFAGYLLLQAVIRVATGPALELDEAEAFWFARELAPGYNAQPPLYFWLQWGMFRIAGEGVLALALLKALILWGAFAALFLLLARAVDVVQAGAAVLALALLPQILWEAQRALTHSVLVFAMAVGFVVLLHRMVTRGGWGTAVALGCVTGLGVLSKYNFVLLPAAFLLAAAVTPAGRRMEWRKVGAAMLLAGVIVAPVALWAMLNPQVATGSLHKLGLDGAGVVSARVAGIGSLVIGMAGFLAPAILVLGGLWLARERRAALRPDLVRYLAGGVLAAVLLLVAGVLVSGATEVRDRWLLPLLWPVVPAAVLWLWPVLSGRQRRGLMLGTGGLWVLAMVALPWASLRDPGWRAGDFAGLEAALAAAEPAPVAVASDVMWVLGNLARRNPDMPLRWTGTGEVPEGALLVTAAGEGAALAARLGLSAGEPVAHVMTRGTREFAVEILRVGPP